MTSLRPVLSDLEDRRAMTLQEAAEVLAVTPATVRSLLDKGKLRGYRLGGRLRIYASSIIDLQDQQAIAPRQAESAPETLRPQRRRSSAQQREALATLGRLGV